MADGADPNLSLRISGDASGAVAAADQTTAKLTQVVRATTQTGAASAEAAAQAQALTAAQIEAGAAMADEAKISLEYGVGLDVAARTLEILAQANIEFVLGSTEMEAALETAQRGAVAASAAQARYNDELGAGMTAALGAAAAQEKLGVVSETLAAQLTRVGLSESEVSAMAMKMGLSLEIAGRAMVQIKQAALADEIVAARVAIEALTASAVEETAAQEKLNVAADTGAMKFGRGSPFFHAMVSTVNMSRGGTMALRGFFEAIELASFALPGFIGPLMLAGATIYEVAEHLDKTKGKLGESTKGVDDYAQSWSLATSQLSGFKHALDEILLQQKDQLANDDRLLANARERSSLASTDAKQDEERRLQALRGQYLQDQAGSMPDDKRKELQDRYAAAEKDIRDGGVVNTALLDAVETQQQIEINTKKLRDAKGAHAANILQLAQAHNAAQEAQTRLDPYGIFLGKDGKKLNRIDPDSGENIDPIAERKNDLKADQSAINRIALTYATQDQSKPEVAAEMAEALKAAKAKQREDQKSLEDLQSALAALMKSKELESRFGPKVQEQETAIKKLQDALAQLQAQLPQKEEAVNLAVTNKNQDAAQAEMDRKRAVYDASVKRFLQGNETDGRGAKFEVRAERKTESDDDHELHEAVTMATQQFRAISGKSAIAAFQKMAAGLDEAQRGSLLLADLAQATDAKTRAIVQRLSAAENAIHALKTHF